jgi:hypothetical protein
LAILERAKGFEPSTPTLVWYVCGHRVVLAIGPTKRNWQSADFDGVIVRSETQARTPSAAGIAMRILLVVLLAISNVAFAAEPDALIENWQLASWQVIVENEVPQNVFGPNPKGYLILTHEGRGIVVTTAESREGGMGDAERAALHKSMLAYSGKYRVESSDFIILE